MLPKSFMTYQAPLHAKHFAFTRGKEEAFTPDHTDWRVDDLLYIDCVGYTLPNTNYLMIREEGHDHWRDQYVFEYVMSGYGHIECNRQFYTVGPGDVYFLNRLHGHRYYADAKEPFAKLWINASGKLLNSLVELYGISEGVVVRHYDSEHLFREMHSYAAALTKDNRTEICNEIGLRLLALIQIFSYSEQREADIHDTANRAQQIKFYIDQHINFDLSLDEIADHFFISQVYLRQIFRKAYGISPKQYIINRRMEAAQNMLSNSNISIREIAGVLHFASPQHFSVAFRREIGISPSEYRSRNAIRQGMI